MVSVNLLASTWNLSYHVFWKDAKFEVKIIAFCQYLLSLAPLSLKNVFKRRSEHDKNIIYYSVFLQKWGYHFGLISVLIPRSMNHNLQK